MNIKKVTIESIITIYRHDDSPEGFTVLSDIRLADCYPNPKIGYQTILRHHETCIDSLFEECGFLIYPFAMPDRMRPGVTAHHSSSLVMTVNYDDGSEEELWLDNPEEPEVEKAQRQQANMVISSFIN